LFIVAVIEGLIILFVWGIGRWVGVGWGWEGETFENSWLFYFFAERVQDIIFPRALGYKSSAYIITSCHYYYYTLSQLQLIN